MQVSLLKERCPPGLAGVEIATVDGFQGREKVAIVISAVRSSPTGEVGFLADDRRMNVAVRAPVSSIPPHVSHLWVQAEVSRAGHVAGTGRWLCQLSSRRFWTQPVPELLGQGRSLRILFPPCMAGPAHAIPVHASTPPA